jgi:tetratricopeptide (TPR) repeat protein
MAVRGELQLLDPTFLLELAQAWLDTFPGACARLAEAAPALGPDPDLRFRSLILRAQATRDRRAAAGFFEAANVLAASGAADAGVVLVLGPTDPFVARRPRLWLAAAAMLARAEAAYAEQNREEAARFLEAAARRGAMDTRCLSDVASAYAAQGQVPRARDLAARAHELAPNDRPLCEAYAWLCLQAGEAALANELFQYAQGLDDEDEGGGRGARLGAACALAQLRRVDEAVDVLQALLREDPDIAEEIQRNAFLEPARARLPLPSAASSRASK